ncbi:MAG: beta-ketoacyl-[acyl-carrier-protein] synthase family protein [Vicinamibacterales bacterium]
MSEPVHITGVGAVSAFGDSRDRFRDALLSGATGIKPVDAFAALGCRSVLAARVADFDAARWIAPMKLRRMDATGPFALVAVQQAMDHAHYNVAGQGDDRAGVVFGTYSAGGHATNDYLAALFRGGPTGAPALMFNSTVANAAAGLAGLEFKLRGPNATISQKEASGLAAIAAAVDLLRAGRADAIAAGGIDAVYEIFFRTHDQFGVMNRACESGDRTAPFSRAREGFVMGEGGFALWLERGSAWRQRGATSYGEVLGVGASSAAVRLNAWPDRPDPIVRTMQLALDDAGLGAADIDVVYAAANASAVVDAVEAEALADLFRPRSPVITSIKGALGECGASGAASCVAAVLCGAVGCVPPIAGLADADPVAGPLRLARSAVPAPGPTVLVNAVASGGALYSLVLRISR